MNKTYDLCVIGGGAAGCMAAIAAGRKNKRVLLLDAKEKIASKIYRTGNGKCNLTNLKMEEDCFFSDDKDHVLQRLSPYDESFLMRFFSELGVLLYHRDGYVYPRTEQAATIVQALNDEMIRLSTDILTDTSVMRIETADDEAFPFKIYGTDGLLTVSKAVLLSTGGLAGEKHPAGAVGYQLAESFGHTIVPPLPSLVPLYSHYKNLFLAAGVRCHAALTLRVDNRIVREEIGQLQIIKGGLSGIPVFQLSHLAAIALSAAKTVIIDVDFLQDVTEDALRKRTEASLKSSGEETLSSFYNGLIHDKLLRMILADHSLQPEMKRKNLAEKVQDSDQLLQEIALSMKRVSFEITHTGTFEDAQVTAGGVPLAEIKENGASRLRDGLFLAGEILNVDGICGGYNLTHAFLSGYSAGEASVSYLDTIV